MWNFFVHKRIRIALSQQHSSHDRIIAIQGLTANPKALRALEQITRDSDSKMAEFAFQKLGHLSDPGALRVILRSIVTNSNSDNARFRDALYAVDVDSILLRTMADEAIPPLLKVGSNVLAWKRENLVDRKNQQNYVAHVKGLLERIDTAVAQSAIAELDRLLRSQLTQELPRLQNIALKSNAFEEAESAIKEIASLGTPAAKAAIILVRSQPPRDMLHSYMAQNPDVETGGSLIEVNVHKSSTDLGNTLKGSERLFWDAAGG
jgi:hypothetical protein